MDRSNQCFLEKQILPISEFWPLLTVRNGYNILSSEALSERPRIQSSSREEAQWLNFLKKKAACGTDSQVMGHKEAQPGEPSSWTIHELSLSLVTVAAVRLVTRGALPPPNSIFQGALVDFLPTYLLQMAPSALRILPWPPRGNGELEGGGGGEEKVVSSRDQGRGPAGKAACLQRKLKRKAQTVWTSPTSWQESCTNTMRLRQDVKEQPGLRSSFKGSHPD